MDKNRITTIECSRYSCQHVEQCLDEYLEDELPIRDKLGVAAHLDECDACQQMVDELKTIVDLAATLGNQSVPEGVSSRLRNRLERETGVRFSRPRAELSLVK